MDKVVEQLKDLRSVKPKKDWVATQRELLLTQIKSQSASKHQSVFINGWYLFKSALPTSFLRFAAKPVGAFVVLCVFVFSTGILGVNASRASLPGDFLYPVKLTSEKVKVGFTVAGEKQAELHVQFAEERVNEIEKVSANEIELSKKKDKIKVAVDGLKKELVKAQDTLDKAKDNTQQKAQNVVDSAKKVDQKATELNEKIKKTKEGLSEDQEITEALTEAEEAVEKTSVKAVAVIVDKYVGGDVQLSEVELVEVIDNKINNAKEKVTAMTVKVTEVTAKAGEVAENAKIVKEIEDMELAEENLLKESVVSEGDTATIERDSTDVVNGNLENNVIEASAVIVTPTTGVSNIKAVEGLKDKPIEATQILTEAKDLLNHGDLASALEKIQQTAVLTNQVKQDVKILDQGLNKEISDAKDVADSKAEEQLLKEPSLK